MSLNKKSCIDNVHTNNHEHVLISGTISEKIAHHLPIFQFSSIFCNNANVKPKHTQYYDYSRSNMDKFVEQLQHKTCELSTDTTDFDMFLQSYTYLIG